MGDLFIDKLFKLRDKRNNIKQMRDDIKEMLLELDDIKHYKNNQDLQIIYELIKEQMLLLDCNLMILKNLY